MIIGEFDGFPYVYLLSEKLYITEKPSVVATVLGSCVSVTMFARRTGLAAICHALLPNCVKAETCPANCVHRYKYVDCVIPRMLEQFKKRNLRPGDLEVNLFGGADMPGAGRVEKIGSLNVRSALGTIRSEKLRLKASDVGGNHGRKIYFYTHTGDIVLKRLKR